MEKIDQLESAIREFDSKYVLEKSSNIFLLDNINEECLDNHLKKYLILEKDEKPIIVLNGKKSFIAMAAPFSGFVLTNKKIHFSLLKRSFLTGLFPLRENPRYLNLESIDSFQIGRHDACFGTAYVGHDLEVNNQTLGLVRLGFKSTLYDDKALKYINDLSMFLFEKGYLKDAPKEYNWQ